MGFVKLIFALKVNDASVVLVISKFWTWGLKLVKFPPDNAKPKASAATYSTIHVQKIGTLTLYKKLSVSWEVTNDESSKRRFRLYIDLRLDS